jgi:hypothetical protein
LTSEALVAVSLGLCLASSMSSYEAPGSSPFSMLVCRDLALCGTLRILVAYSNSKETIIMTLWRYGGSLETVESEWAIGE